MGSQQVWHGYHVVITEQHDLTPRRLDTHVTRVGHARLLQPDPLQTIGVGGQESLGLRGMRWGLIDYKQFPGRVILG
jgi:hypothetical protein